MRKIAFAVVASFFMGTLTFASAQAQPVAQSQRAKPACGTFCQGYCQKRVAAGTSVGFSKCMQACNSSKANGSCV